MVALHLNVVLAPSHHQPIPSGGAASPRSPLKECTLLALPPFRKLVLFGLIVDPVYMELDRLDQFLLLQPLFTNVLMFHMTSQALWGQPFTLVIPLPVSIWELEEPGLFPAEL